MKDSPLRRLVLLPLLLALAAPASAELVVFTDGGFLQVQGSRLVPGGGEERLELRFEGGGTLILPLSRVARVVEDEVVQEPEPEPPSAADLGLPLHFTDDQAVPATPFGELIYRAARRWRLNPALVAAVVRAESAFDAAARSGKGARGLMQLMPSTAHRFGVGERDLFDPAKNLDAGTRYLAWLISRFDGDLPRALAAYNAGEATVDRFGGIPPYRETRSYILRIYASLGLAMAELPL